MEEDEFAEKKRFFESYERFQKVIATEEDYEEARRIESEMDYRISFFDIFHMILARNNKAILVTRDMKLIKIAVSKGIVAKVPEELE